MNEDYRQPDHREQPSGPTTSSGQPPLSPALGSAAEIERLRAALQDAITDAYDARSMIAAHEYSGARSVLWDSCKKMESAVKPNAPAQPPPTTDT